MTNIMRGGVSVSEHDKTPPKKPKWSKGGPSPNPGGKKKQSKPVPAPEPVETTAQKQPKRHGFQPGVSGNPAGRPKGARHKYLIAMENMLDGESEAITRKAIELAKDGDLQALRLCMERLLPPRRERPISIDMPKISVASDLIEASSALMQAVADGELVPGEAAALGQNVILMVFGL